MYFHILLTLTCNLHCKYCFGGSVDDIDSDFNFNVDYSLPKEIDYNIRLLADFCEQDPDCVLSFYGGEPTLCTHKMKEIMDKVKAKHFLIHTNALHLDEIESEYINRFHTISVSIDGCRELTDYYRGEGVYQKVIENLRNVKRNGYKGEVIARMTVMEETDIVKEVKWLLDNEDFSFSSIHWQLNAGFWKNDFAKRPFERWVNDSYNPGIRCLVKFWVDKMDRKGEVLKLYPFLGIMQSMLKDERSLLRCGSGWINYSILTNGTIVPCPVMSGMKDYSLGHISEANPIKLGRVFVEEPCTQCEVYDVCGGRCLYANITKRWSAEAYSLVCKTVKNSIACLEQEVPRVHRMISQGKIKLSDFSYLKYSGCEIIP